MKAISTKVHGVLDYLVGIILIAAPWLLNFYRGGAESWVPILLGIGTVMYSLFTNYEYSMSKVIPMRVHLTLDVISGIFLALSPWLFNFDEFVYLPHVIIGILETLVGLMTETAPKAAGYRTQETH
jgi:hypothetical protein